MKNKDWTGNTQAVMATLNASSHSKEDRADWDYYATPKLAVEELLRIEHFNKNNPIWECAAGEKHISNVLEEHDYLVYSSDIIQRIDDVEQLDFLENNNTWNSDIITNPPFSKALEFIEKALSIVNEGAKIAFFLRIQFLEGVKRRKFFEQNPPIRVWISSRNMRCAKNGDFKNATGNASTYCWFIWEKGFKGKPEIGWFN